MLIKILSPKSLLSFYQLNLNQNYKDKTLTSIKIDFHQNVQAF